MKSTCRIAGNKLKGNSITDDTSNIHNQESTYISSNYPTNPIHTNLSQKLCYYSNPNSETTQFLNNTVEKKKHHKRKCYLQHVHTFSLVCAPY